MFVMFMIIMDTGQTVDEPASPGDLPEDGHMLVEEIADKYTVPLSDELRFFWLHIKYVALAWQIIIIQIYTVHIYVLIRK